MSEKVVILDFGAQYSQLIARRVRECGVYSEIIPGNSSTDEIKKRDASGLILSGGPSSVYADDALLPDPGVYEMGLPILGICYGHQLLAMHFGKSESVGGGETGAYGRMNLYIEKPGILFEGLSEKLPVWVSHGDLVNSVPDGFCILASTESTPVAAMVHAEKKIYGVQFHPEVHHTSKGKKIIENWLYGVCGFSGKWNMQSFADNAVAKVKDQVGYGHALCALSGGVDSSVAATLVHQAIGDRLTCIFVDHGLLRKDEPKLVRKMFTDQLNMNVIFADERQRFLEALKGVSDPEEKRRIIGHEFIEVFEEHARQLGDFDYLVQGTIYPDVVESGASGSSTIKSHHNVGGLPEHMQMELVEPLRELFKDEVRRAGSEIGLSDKVLWRHPFPGPGLAVRVMGDITEEKLEMARTADAIFEKQIRDAGLYRELWQSFAVLTNDRSVGVKGDERTYGRTIVLRAVTSEDAMTADWARLPHEVLDETSRQIVNGIDGVNRVVYDVTSKPPGTIEWE